jgi:hypothetical protein
MIEARGELATGFSPAPATALALAPERVPTLTEVLQARAVQHEPLASEALGASRAHEAPMAHANDDDMPAMDDAAVLDQLHLDVQAEVMAELAPRLQELLQPLVAEVVKKAITAALGGPR